MDLPTQVYEYASYIQWWV
uniref:Uncharacterized protein n=1 Tax=Arundo donax TaxID=35708 RepID=A0A0A9CAL2_ARUDO